MSKKEILVWTTIMLGLFVLAIATVTSLPAECVDYYDGGNKVTLCPIER